MKKIILSAFAIMAMIACERKEKTVESDTEVIRETDVIERPADTVVKEVDEAEGTSVSVSGDGINVSSNNGEKKTEVNVDAKR